MCIIVYIYFGYPSLLCCISQFKKKPVKKEEIYPKVSLIIAVHNEENNIKEKLKNTLNLEYPKEKLEIIVASDASTDKTNAMVSSFRDAKIRLLEFSEHKGKTSAQNEAVKEAKGEIILFSDATTIYDPQLLKIMVRNFSDITVGAVGGELVYVHKNNTSVGKGNGFYWKYEKFLKKKESQITSLIGVSGCCYAVRKELYESIKPDLISDFVIAQMIYKKGKRTVYEPEAISSEETNITAKDEFRMRERVALRTFYGLWYMRGLLNPCKYGFFSIQLMSHKLLRSLVPVFLIFLFLTNSLLISMQTEILVYKICLLLQVFFYISAFFGKFTKKMYLYIPFYFCVTNFALLVGLFKFIKGERRVVWKPTRK